ncbi:MAG: lipocalin family protein [Proteobacteria bacterium]|nr:lipocalin family protein [Pseudomonadota bacterium]
MKRTPLPAKPILGAAALAATAAGLLAWRKRARAQACGNPHVPQPAKPVDLERYLGLWHELGRYENRFERGCERVTAEYVLRADGLIDVINTCGGGKRRRVSRGRAKILPDSGGAKLKVSFFGPFFLGDYWVLDHDDEYRWSIVGEPSGRYLWVLHREPDPGEDAVQQLLQRVGELGYDTARVRRTLQP